MERESFEDEAVGAFLNEHFVSVKLDREERPDVDRIYMTAAQAMLGGGGGWPLNVFLTPDLKPFYGGTYFPPKPSRGRPSFMQLLRKIAELWRDGRDDLLTSATETAAQLKRTAEREPAGDDPLTSEILESAARSFKREYEPVYGGFGRSPKFPRPTLPGFLLRHGVARGDKEAVEMVLHTCRKMADGGMNDQLGGGFARYSVDERWLVPHFEKMLYDNAQLANLYLDAWLVSGEARHARTARETIDYVLRDMTHPNGGFYSAEDADSEGHEGKFYCWTKKEIEAALPRAEAETAIRCFGVTEEGNFTDHSHPSPLPSQNVLSAAVEPAAPEDARLLASARTKLLELRAGRVRPHLDDKILASWNGLMLSAVARSALLLDEPAHRTAADRNMAFVKETLWDAGTRTLSHRWRGGETDAAQLLNAYAFMTAAALDMYETTLDPLHLQFALDLTDSAIDRFHDPDKGGFFQSADSPDLLFRMKPDYDEAEPSGNSVMVLNLLRLARISEIGRCRDMAGRILRLFAARLRSVPRAVPLLASGLDAWLSEGARLVIVGERGSEAFQALLRAAHSVFVPNKIVMGAEGPVEEFARGLPGQDRPAAYLCAGSSCQAPVDDPDKLRELLRATIAFQISSP